MNNSYTRLTESLDSGSLGVVAGIISGLSINVITGQELTRYSGPASVLIMISVFFVIKLLRNRQDIDESVSKKEVDESKPGAVKTTRKQKWLSAISADDTATVRKFFAKFYAAVICLLLGIALLVAENYMTTNKQDVINEIIINQSSQMDSVNNRLLQVQDSISVLKKRIDSLHAQTLPVVSKDNKTNRTTRTAGG